MKKFLNTVGTILFFGLLYCGINDHSNTIGTQILLVILFLIFGTMWFFTYSVKKKFQDEIDRTEGYNKIFNQQLSIALESNEIERIKASIEQNNQWIVYNRNLLNQLEK